jgi:hypothetical protein
MEATEAAAPNPTAESGGVAGRVELVTDRPIVLPRRDSPRARAEALLIARPWLVPGLLLGVIALLLLRRAPPAAGRTRRSRP